MHSSANLPRRLVTLATRTDEDVLVDSCVRAADQRRVGALPDTMRDLRQTRMVECFFRTHLPVGHGLPTSLQQDGTGTGTTG